MLVVRLSESWAKRRYLSRGELKLKKEDFPVDTIFITGGKMSQVRITEDRIDEIMAKTDFHVETFGGKTTVVMATLPNGYIIVESSSCVDPANYCQELGEKICKERIKDKIWELEGYLLQTITAANNALIDNAKLANP